MTPHRKVTGLCTIQKLTGNDSELQFNSNIRSKCVGAVQPL